MSAGEDAPRPWLVGPAADLLLGCGVLYMIVFAAFGLAGAELRNLTPVSLPVLLALLLSAPHYGATLLRVYENRADRGKYFLFAVHATLAVCSLYLVGLTSVTVASWLLTLYLIWSPWHYTGQNYGLALVFARRRGVTLSASVKRLLHASFVLSYLLLLLVVFTGDEPDHDLARGYGAVGHETIRIQSLGIPGTVVNLAAPVAVAYVWVTIAAFVGLMKVGRIRDLVPTALLVLTQALWFSLPMLARFSGVGVGIDPLDPDQRAVGFIWITLAHAVQYLWVTSYYARTNPGWHGTSSFLVKAAVVGTALWTVPLVAFAPLRAMSGDQGFYLLLASCINIHHFILDGAIWKLRDSRVANVLLRDPTSVPSARITRATRRRWLRNFVWGVAAVGAVLAIVRFQFESQLLNASQAGAPDRISAALDGLDWFGLDSARSRKLLAKEHLEAGDDRAAIRALTRSLALEPGLEGYSELAYLQERDGDLRASLVALESALELDPDRLGLLHRAGTTQLRLGRPELAQATLERALRLDPNHEPSRSALQKARRAASRGRDSP